MTEQQVNSRRHVLLAVLFFVVALAAFASAFYVYDGASLVREYLADASWPFAAGDTGEGPGSSDDATSTPDAGAGSGELRLPEGMPEEFALRLWQEQIDSQDNIRRLVDGEVISVAINDVQERGDRAVLGVDVRFKDATAAKGTLEMVRFGDTWYFARVTGLHPDAAVGDTPIPKVDDVDVGVLNTILEQHQGSSQVLQEYADGVITKVVVNDIVTGPGTARLTLEMEQTHPHVGWGDLVMISKEIGGETVWFLARFTKTQDVPS